MLLLLVMKRKKYRFFFIILSFSSERWENDAKSFFHLSAPKWLSIHSSTTTSLSLYQPLSPNQQRTLNKLPPELRRRNLVNDHRLGMQIGAKCAKTCTQTCAYSDWASILHATVGGWVSSYDFVADWPAKEMKLRCRATTTTKKKPNKKRLCSKTCRWDHDGEEEERRHLTECGRQSFPLGWWTLSQQEQRQEQQLVPQQQQQQQQSVAFHDPRAVCVVVPTDKIYQFFFSFFHPTRTGKKRSFLCSSLLASRSARFVVVVVVVVAAGSIRLLVAVSAHQSCRQCED